MNTVCAACMATNRLPEERIDDGAKCGCGHSLFDGEVINATTETLDKLLQDDSAGGHRLLGFRGAALAAASCRSLKTWPQNEPEKSASSKLTPKPNLNSVPVSVSAAFQLLCCIVTAPQQFVAASTTIRLLRDHLDHLADGV